MRNLNRIILTSIKVNLFNFPQPYSQKEGIDRARWNSVINKTPIYARANRIIGGYAPPQYLSSLERNHVADPKQLNASLTSHQIDVDAIRADDFDTYFKKRQKSFLDLIDKATGKEVSGREEPKAAMSQYEITEMEITTEHGAIPNKTQTKEVAFYNLDAIISVGYRVNSTRAIQFRLWLEYVVVEIPCREIMIF